MVNGTKTARRLKIGLVLDDSLDKPDGVQQYVLSVGAWLAGQGHEVHYLVGQTTRQDLPNIHSLSRNIGVRFNHNAMSMPLPTGKRQLRTFLEREQFDILHVQLPYSPWLAGRMILAASAKTAIVGTFHILPYSPLVRLGSRVLAMWTHRSLKRFRAVVSVSPAAAEFAQQVFGLTTDVVPNAFDYQRFHSAQPLARKDQRLNILFLGRLVSRKGCHTLLQAVANLRQTRPELDNYRVTVCGTGPLLPQLEAFVDQHDLGGLVSFAGFVPEDEKPRYYASADIAVFPSSGGESFGIVLVEAMASGRAAVLAGDNPGYRSVMAPQPELLFDPRQADVLGARLAHYLTDAKARQAAAHWGQTHAQRFDSDVVGQQLTALYRRALRKPADQ